MKNTLDKWISCCWEACQCQQPRRGVGDQKRWGDEEQGLQEPGHTYQGTTPHRPPGTAPGWGSARSRPEPGGVHRLRCTARWKRSTWRHQLGLRTASPLRCSASPASQPPCPGGKDTPTGTHGQSQGLALLWGPLLPCFKKNKTKQNFRLWSRKIQGKQWRWERQVCCSFDDQLEGKGEALTATSLWVRPAPLDRHTSCNPLPPVPAGLCD